MTTLIPRRTSLFLIPLLIGVGILILLLRGGSQPERDVLTEPARTVRFIEAPLVTVVPRALGYGRVRPVRIWEGVAEVSGRIVAIHPRLRKGALIPGEALLVRIDPREYELAVSQVQADILSAKAQLAEMAVKEANTQASLQIEAEALELREAELRRKARLVGKGTLSESEFEQEQRNLLSQRQQVQAQKNALALLPAERELLQAQLARYEAQLAKVRLDLSHTEIRLPFRARIAEVNIEETQYVREGSLLVKADAIDKAEVEAQIPIARMRTLLHSEEPIDLNRLDPSQLAHRLGIEAQVWLRDSGGDVRWDARFTRMSDTLDPDTRTIGVIVEVDQPYAGVQPGKRPPLVKGLFVEVELRGPPRPERLVLPRHALHGDRVYLVEGDRLSIRPVEVDSLLPDYALIGAGLAPGDRVVVSDLVPAIEGMRLQGQADEDALGRLVRAAAARD